MRRITIGALTILLAFAILGVLVGGCGSAAEGQTSATTAQTSAGGTATTAAAAANAPQDILNKAVTSAKPMPNVTGTFDVSLTVNGDQSKMPAEAKAMLSQPITISGTIAATEKPLAADVAIKAAFAGQEIPVGFRTTGGKAWIQFMNVWYEAPAELMSAMTAAGSTSTTDQAALLQQLKAAGLDPATWITDLKTVGEEDIDGVKTYHLSGSIDIAKVISDGMKASQDKSLQSLIPGAGSQGSTDSTDTAMSLPSATDLAGITNEISTMFKSVTVDAWITKDGYELRKATLNAQIVPPAGQDSQGITDLTLKATIAIAPAKDAVAVAAPTDVKPWSELEQALGGLSQMFGGLLGGTSGLDSSTTVPSEPGATDTTVQ